jgi:hypothetical protein
MILAEFIARLEPHATEPLSFTTAGQRTPAGYHVTEFKAASVQAVDCGGRAATWNEIVLQVLPPAAPTGETSMSVGKFLAIYGRVAGSIPLPADALVRVEYGANGATAVSYLVNAIEAGPDGVTVDLAPPTVTCKANYHSIDNVPTVAAHTRPRLGDAAGQQPAPDCCPPTGSVTLSARCCA